jgi:predicted NBD/HSP70 family sugar kinase
MASSIERDILRAIQLLQHPTRQEIARRLNLRAASVGPYLARLRHSGLVRSVGKKTGAGGRPAVLYQLDPSFGCTIGVFFETFTCQIIAVDPAGSPVVERTREISLSAAGSVVEDIVDVVQLEMQNLLADPRLAKRKVLAMGVAPPGWVDTVRGYWVHGLRLSGMEHVPLGQLLQSALGIPVLVEDQSRCVAQVAASKLGVPEAGDLLLIYLGAGVGAGIVLKGELHRGYRGMAGCIGHFVVEENGDRCPCGKQGCLESVASLPAVLRRFQRRLDEGVLSRLQDQNEGDSNRLTVEQIREAAGAGDRFALATIAEIGRALGNAVSKAIMLFNPRTVCFGGPVAALGAFLQDSLWDTFQHQLMPELLRDLQVEFRPAPCADEALGAALLASRWYWSECVDRAEVLGQRDV